MQDPKQAQAITEASNEILRRELARVRQDRDRLCDLVRVLETEIERLTYGRQSK